MFPAFAFTLAIVAAMLTNFTTLALPTTYDQYQYLSEHNAIRAAHGAAPLSWSYSLAESAQNWASSCKFTSSGGSLRTTPYGENYSAGTGRFTIPKLLKVLSADESQYDPANPTYNHFTQLAWKATTEVGCAVASCDGILDKTASFYVCLYNPVGNVVGEALSNVQV